MKGHSGNRIHCFKQWTAFYGLVFLAVGICISCWPSRLSLPPLPPRIESIEGYGSLKIKEDQGSSKIKFSFLFFLPHQGRIESFDFIGRSLYYILIDKEESFFVLPSKKVYWQGNVEKVISRSLGFSLNQYEMICLLRGEWKGTEFGLEAEKSLKKWSFIKDEKGRIVEGQREDLRFKIKEFIENSQFARLVLFYHPWSEGQLKILKINFNQPLKPAAFSRPFLEKYKLKTWAEIEKLINNEN